MSFLEKAIETQEMIYLAQRQAGIVQSVSRANNSVAFSLKRGDSMQIPIIFVGETSIHVDEFVCAYYQEEPTPHLPYEPFLLQRMVDDKIVWEATGELPAKDFSVKKKNNLFVVKYNVITHL